MKITVILLHGNKISLHKYLDIVTDSKQFEDFVDNQLNADDSDLEMISDDDDVDVDPPYVVEEEHQSEEDSDTPDEEASDDISSRPNELAQGTSHESVLEHRQSNDRVFWKKTNDFWPLPPAPEPQVAQVNAVNLPPNSYVSKCTPDNIFALLTEHTNRNYLLKKGSPLGLTEECMRKFFAATIMMSLLGYPRIRMYWATDTKVPFIASQMSRDMYFKIRKYLKIVTDTEVSDVEKNSNKFWKVGPLLKSVQIGCLLNPRPTNLAIDEQMVPFWGHAPGRQVIKTKPNPCGLKAADGLALDFFFYQGKGDPIVTDLHLQHLDVAGKAVMKLLNNCPKVVSVYLDRYFTSVTLFDTMYSEAEATGTGTLNKKRVPQQSKLKTDAQLKKRAEEQ